MSMNFFSNLYQTQKPYFLSLQNAGFTITLLAK